MRLALVEMALGAAGVPATEGTGVYVWADGEFPDAYVLYIGEAANVRKRIGDEQAWAEQFAQLRHAGHSLWESAGCGLSAVLATASSPTVFTWPMDASRRKLVQVALIRLAALTGGTPPAQGAGWDYDRGRSALDIAASGLLGEWFNGQVGRSVERDAPIQQHSADGKPTHHLSK